MERLHKNFTKEAVEVVGPPAWKVVGPTLKKGFNDAMGQLKKFKFDNGIRPRKGKLFMGLWSFIPIFCHSQQSRHFMTLF